LKVYSFRLKDKKRRAGARLKELFGNTGWLLYNGNAPFGIKAVVLRLAVREIAYIYVNINILKFI